MLDAATAHQRDHHYDVCVVGGGMSGLCAALAAARHGARTCLVHDRPVLGGNASSEVRMHICGARGPDHKETGLLEELQLANQARNPLANHFVWDAVMRDAAMVQPGLDLLLNCTCTGVTATGPAEARQIEAISCWQLTTQTWHRITATSFIDCSGDGVLAVDSGAQYMWGREARGAWDEDIEPPQADTRTMGNSLLIQVREGERPVRFTPPPTAYRFGPDDFPCRLKGVHGHNYWWIELGGLADTIRDAESIGEELHRAVWGVWDYIKNVAPEREAAACWELEWVGALPGKRENRRFCGLHVLNQNEVTAGGDFPDIVAYGGWSMDDHHPAGLLYPDHPTVHHPAPSPYGIPYRCLVSRNVRNLLFAGRTISASHAAMSTTRVMATCALLGQAAGTAAALCCARGCEPAQLYPTGIAALQAALMDDDVWLPGRARATDPLAEAATCSAPVLCSGHDRPVNGDSQAWCGNVGSPVTFRWSAPQPIAGLRLVCDSDLGDNKRMPFRYPATLAVPACLLRDARVEIDTGDGVWRVVDRISDNHQRLIRRAIACEATALRIVPERTWGGGEAVRLFAAEPQAQPPQRRLPDPQRPSWRQRVAAVDPADLAPPANPGRARG
ncbi:MAG: FAD-dependent oxidoreductase [Planctomycetota bacterium]